MSVLKVINDANNSHDDLEFIVDYVTKKPFTDFSTMVETKGCRKNSIIRDMDLIKNLNHQNNGKMYEHMVLSITPDLKHTPDSDYMEIGRRISDHYIGHQCVYALHKDSGYRHLHFVFNSVNYMNGKKFSQGPKELNAMKTYCNHVLEQYDLDAILHNLLPVQTDKKNVFSNGTNFLEIGNSDKPIDRNIMLDDPDSSPSCFGSFRKYNLNKIFGGNIMNNHTYNLAYNNGSTLVHSENSGFRSKGYKNNGLNLVNVNNIEIPNIDALEEAVQKTNQAFASSASAAAEALSVLRDRKIYNGVNVYTVNNFYLPDSQVHNNAVPIEVPCSTLPNDSSNIQPYNGTNSMPPAYIPQNFTPFGFNGNGCPPMPIF